MGSIKKALYKVVGGKSYRVGSNELKVAEGQGRFVNGQYQAYNTAEKEHYNAAEANRGSQFQDIAQNSGLGSNWGAGMQSLLGNVKKKKQAGTTTLLGGAAGGKQTLGG